MENISIEWRFAEGKVDRLPKLAAKLAALKPALSVTGGTGPTRASKKATSTIPIVMANDNDPVGSRIVANLGRLGGNITGLTSFAQELAGKRLKILREVVPKLSRVLVMGSSIGPSFGPVRNAIEVAAKALGVSLQNP